MSAAPCSLTSQMQAQQCKREMVAKRTLKCVFHTMALSFVINPVEEAAKIICWFRLPLW